MAWPFASTVDIDPVNPHIVMIASPGEGCNIRNFYFDGPVRSNLKPTGTLSHGTNTTEISLSTLDSSECRYSEFPGTDFNDMAGIFSTTDGKIHSSEIIGLSDGNTYRYYCKCQDGNGLSNPDDFRFTFRIGTDASGLKDKQTNGKLSIQSYPLAGEGVKFSVNLNRQTDLMLRVYDMSGKQVWFYWEHDAGAGVHEINWLEPNSQKGIYCVVLTSQKETYCSSLLFMK